ncbi:uncharacterized protein LOC100867713 [Apis florea]|uniref:uncharacterized protein LOC100867713 n=1 Tax=Apis florea TaxID=7463 RepID=UPI000252AC5F|nr:uncharacterized protein LOC100867713 [Apis florea]
MEARRLVLGSAILGLFWSGLFKGALTNSTNRCDYPPCSCDSHGRLTCDCKEEGEELVLTTDGDKRLSPHTSRIAVSNCSSVILANSSLASMVGLRAIDLINVANLTLVRQSFELSPQSTRTWISVRNCSIDTMPSFVFRGDVEAIILENVRIGQLSAFSFANLVHTEKLRLENCRIESIEAQAFKKFDVGHLRVIGTRFGDQVPSRTMNDIEVYHTFMLDGVRMGTVRSEAFIVRSPRTVAIQNCVVESLESEAFDVTARGPVIVKNNTFGSLSMGAFLGVRADAEARTPPAASLHDLIFKNNSVVNFEEGSIMFDRNSFRLELDNLLVGRSCDCRMLPVWKNNILNYTNLYSRFSVKQNTAASSLASASQDALPINETPETFLCYDGETSNGVAISFVEYEARHCSLGGSILVFVLLIAALLLLSILIACLIVWCCRRRRRNSRKKWISVPMNAPDVVSKKNGVIGREAATSATPVDSRITMVVPDGRLYRETEFHVIVEKAEPLTTEL